MPELKPAQMDFLQALARFAREHGCTFGNPSYGEHRPSSFSVQVPTLGLFVTLRSGDLPGSFTLTESRKIRIGYPSESSCRSEWSVE